MVLVDSSVWIDYFSTDRSTPQTEHLEQLVSTTPIVVGDLILAEVLQGFKSDSDYKTARSLLENFELVNISNTDIAIKSADNYRQLRKKGLTVRKTIDCLIATYCIENNIALLHSDRDFDAFVKNLGLKLALNSANQ